MNRRGASDSVASRAGLRAGFLAASLLALPACDDGGRTRAAGDDDGAVLVLDGMRITRADIAELEPYLRSVEPRAGRMLIASKALAHLIPLALARRGLAARREILRERAEALRRVVGNGGYPELVAKGRVAGGFRPRRPLTRNELPLPLARWAFDEANVGRVSPVLETAQGFSLIATREIVRGVTRAGDTADIFQVPFYTHPSKEFGAWLASARAAIADKVELVDPEYAPALPRWLKIPTEKKRKP